MKRDKNIEEYADTVAVNATRIAIFAGIVAVGATLFAGDKTRKKISEETRGVITSLRDITTLLRRETDKIPQLKG